MTLAQPEPAPPPTPPLPDERSVRILAAALALTEEGGFPAVKLRDVAQSSGVALGTLYKRFRSKEELMLAVVNQELNEFQSKVAGTNITGSRSERLLTAFMSMTDFLLERPNLGRALVRSVHTADGELAESLICVNATVADIIGIGLVGAEPRSPTAWELEAVGVLQGYWFSLMVGWAIGVQSRGGIEDNLRKTIHLLDHGLHGLAAMAQAE
ncbi:putative tetR-family regulatory protein [Plesiocystis pacifica SIR-1]|uniref:Putative tetR-family regulatory protein n=1 Tax=Plesiocystis pacifica SIR-1 TaxID=391625 RepID=A6GHT3_9BACT|nr:TetR/AcrR family transcriptional regulator [Plesiocystis pacifica]EDM74579.1 putative tetR-family regulatory protein [Plesiocystis pacifica SIR-1]